MPPGQASRFRHRAEPPSWVRRVGLWSWYFIGFCGAIALLAFIIAASRDITVPLILAAFLAVAFAPSITS